MEQAPADLVLVGRILAAWGIRGAIKVMPYAQDGAALLEVRQWWVKTGEAWRSVDVRSAKHHGDAVVAELTGYIERTTAERLKGHEIWIARSRFPALSDDEYYWVDLIGMRVVNQEGALLGQVAALTEHGAHAILEVQRVADAVRPAMLIPFVERYVKSVDRDQQQIVVDWGPEYEE